MRRKRYVMKSYVAMIWICIVSLGMILGSTVPIDGTTEDGNNIFEYGLLEDDFTDVDVTDTLWDVESGNWTVKDGHIQDEGGSIEQIITAGSTTWKDYSLIVDMKAIDNAWPFMITRYQDTSNFYFLQAQFRNNTIILGKRIDGQVTEYAVNYNMTMGETYRFKVTILGDQIACYVVEGDTETLLLEETFDEIATGPIGLRNKWVTANFDYVAVYGPNAMRNDAQLRVMDVSTDDVTFAWESVEGVTQYRLYRQENEETSQLIYEGMNTSYVDSDVTMNTTYKYYLNYDREGYTAEDSEILIVTTDVAIPHGVGSVVTYSFHDAIRIEWAEVEGASRYHLYGSDSYDGTYVEIYNGAELFYVEQGLEEGVQRYYQVTAENDAGESEPSVIVEARTTMSQTSSVVISGNTIGYLGDMIQLQVDSDLSQVNYKVYRLEDGKMMYIHIHQPIIEGESLIHLQTAGFMMPGDYVVVVGNSQVADAVIITLQKRPGQSSRGIGNAYGNGNGNGNPNGNPNGNNMGNGTGNNNGNHRGNGNSKGNGLKVGMSGKGDK